MFCFKQACNCHPHFLSGIYKGHNILFCFTLSRHAFIKANFRVIQDPTRAVLKIAAPCIDVDSAITFVLERTGLMLNPVVQIQPTESFSRWFLPNPLDNVQVHMNQGIQVHVIKEKVGGSWHLIDPYRETAYVGTRYLSTGSHPLTGCQKKTGLKNDQTS